MCVCVCVCVCERERERERERMLSKKKNSATLNNKPHKKSGSNDKHE